MRCSPGSQSRRMMAQKRDEANRLLARGLTVGQVSAQLRCSRTFVRGIRDELQEAAGRSEEPVPA